MSGKNNFLARIEQARKEGFIAGQHFTRQLCMDLSAVVLNHEFGFGADRLEAYNAAMVEMYGDYADIFNADTKDIEYSKDYIDRALKQIWGDRFEDWEARYNKWRKN